MLEFISRCINLFYLLFLRKMTIRAGEVNWLISVDIFARIILSHFILKTKLYKHHYFSLILITIGFFTMSSCAFMAIAERELDNWPYFFFVILKYIFLPLEDVFNKILLTDKFLLPHYLMFWRGIIDFLFLIFFSLITIIPGFIQFHFFEQFDTTSKIIIQFFLMLLYTIFSLCKAFCLLKVIDIFTPQHVAFCHSAFCLYLLLLCRISHNDNKFITVFDSVFLILIIVGILLFNEVLIINAFGLNKNTKKGIIQKEKIELQNMKKITDDSDEEENDSEDKEEALDTKEENINEVDKNKIIDDDKNIENIDDNNCIN